MGGGNTAMDCCRTSLRLGAESVTVVVRSAFEVMKASEWEKEDAMREGIPIINNRPPKEFVHENGKLKGVLFECVKPVRAKTGAELRAQRRSRTSFSKCDHVLMAIGQDNHCPWIERDVGMEFDKWDCPVLDEVTFPINQPEGVLRRRQCVWPGKYHLGVRPRPSGGHSHPPLCARAKT